MLRLEKVEFGGVKGKALSARVVIIFEEFKTEFEKFGNKKYDPLEPSSDEFKADYDEFCKFTLDLDRRLSSTICQGFDDCNSLQSVFKLITILGNLLERKTIATDFDPKYYILGEMLEAEMDAAKLIFDEQDTRRKENKQLNLHRNMPDVSGALRWCKELQDRVSKPMETYKRLISHESNQSDQIVRTEKKYQEMLDLIDGFASNIYADWCQHVGGLSNNNLDKNLINRNADTNIIETNFDSQLTAVLKEVKYLGFLKKADIPKEAKDIHEQNDQYRKFITSLDYTVASYNKILTNASEEERPLIAEEMAKIDAEIKQVC